MENSHVRQKLEQLMKLKCQKGIALTVNIFTYDHEIMGLRHSRDESRIGIFKKNKK